MPYLQERDRGIIDGALNRFLSDIGRLNAGGLNYIVTRLLTHNEPSTYQEYNDLIGALECCKLELYRRAVAPYEDVKIKENGDVYG